MKGWHRDNYRHSLAARGIRSSFYPKRRSYYASSASAVATAYQPHGSSSIDYTGAWDKKTDDVGDDYSIFGVGYGIDDGYKEKEVVARKKPKKRKPMGPGQSPIFISMDSSNDHKYNTSVMLDDQKRAMDRLDREEQLKRMNEFYDEQLEEERLDMINQELSEDRLRRALEGDTYAAYLSAKRLKR